MAKRRRYLKVTPKVRESIIETYTETESMNKTAMIVSRECGAALSATRVKTVLRAAGCPITLSKPSIYDN